MFTEKELGIIEGLVRRKIEYEERRMKARPGHRETTALYLERLRGIMLKLQQEWDNLLAM